MIPKVRTSKDKKVLFLGVAAGVIAGALIPEIHEAVKGMVDKVKGGTL